MNIHYIQGFFDGEGSVSNSPKKHKVLFITNTDKGLLLEISEYLKSIDIENKIKIHNQADQNPKHNHCYRLFITGYGNIVRYGKKIGFYSQKNKDRYERMIELYNLNIKKYPNCNLLKK